MVRGDSSGRMRLSVHLGLPQPKIRPKPQDLPSKYGCGIPSHPHHPGAAASGQWPVASSQQAVATPRERQRESEREAEEEEAMINYITVRVRVRLQLQRRRRYSTAEAATRTMYSIQYSTKHSTARK